MFRKTKRLKLSIFIIKKSNRPRRNLGKINRKKRRWNGWYRNELIRRIIKNEKGYA